MSCPPSHLKGRKVKSNSSFFFGSSPIKIESEVSEVTSYLNLETVDALQECDISLPCEVGSDAALQEGMFKCPVCYKSFTQFGTMNRHLKLHSGGNTFTCSICGSEYNRNDNLIRHMRTTHGLFEERLRAPKCP